MADLKHVNPSTILWLDMEMTGLRPTTDRIVEAAAIATDWDFNELGVITSGVGQNEQTIKELFNQNPWAAARPAETQELIDLSRKSPAEPQVEAAFVQFVEQHAKENIVLLAGNSIHQDRQFIRARWPNLEAKLHYRMLDVSAWKVVMQAKFGLEFPKKETHRALDDIRESIAELKFYLERAKW